jgi:hypothetical protein
MEGSGIPESSSGRELLQGRITRLPCGNYRIFATDSLFRDIDRKNRGIFETGNEIRRVIPCVKKSSLHPSCLHPAHHVINTPLFHPLPEKQTFHMRAKFTVFQPEIENRKLPFGARVYPIPFRFRSFYLRALLSVNFMRLFTSGDPDSRFVAPIFFALFGFLPHIEFKDRDQEWESNRDRCNTMGPFLTSRVPSDSKLERNPA